MNRDNAFSLGNTSDDGADSIVIELEAHDASRFEWRVAIPLPTHQHLSYSVQAEFELPSTSVLSPSPWNQLQGFTRLEEPQLPGESGEQSETVHVLRQQTLVLQQMLERARQGVLRHCRLVCEKPGEETAVESLVTWLNTAFRALAKARARAVASKVDDSSQIVRERELADEFVSVRLIEFVAEAEATTQETLGRAFGFERAMDSAGAVIGPALSLAFVAAVGMRNAFLLTLIPGLIAVTSIALVVRENPHAPDLRHGIWHGMNHLPSVVSDEFVQEVFGSERMRNAYWTSDAAPSSGR
jgi:hypothetical protein